MGNRNFRLSELKGRIALVVLVVCGFGVSVAVAANDTALTLSWNADQKETTIGWPGNDGDESCTITLYLTLVSATPVDSLSMNLRWATREKTGGVRFHGMAGANGEVLTLDPGAKPASGGSFRPLDQWLSDPGFLKQIESGNAETGYRYRLSTRVTLTAARTLKLLASGVNVKSTDGVCQKPGNATASIGEGWALDMPPLITEVKGLLNQVALKSKLTLIGEDLNRLVRFALIDPSNSRALPTKISFNTRERIEMMFTTKSLAPGYNHMEFGAPSGWIDSAKNAVEAVRLDQPQPFDEMAMPDK
jgi:hypothetical protein